MKILNYAKKKIFNISNNRVTIPKICDSAKDTFVNNVYKSECVKALNCKEPYELAFVLDKDGKSLGKFVGKKEKCLIDDLPRKSKLVILHGHPQRENGKTLPVSLGDFEFLNRNSNVDKIVAFDKNGAQSFLQKDVGFKSLTDKQVSELKVSYILTLIDSAPAPEVEKISSLIKYCMQNGDNCKMVKQELVERIDKLQFGEKSDIAIDKFWKEIAPKYKLIYHSTFK